MGKSDQGCDSNPERGPPGCYWAPPPQPQDFIKMLATKSPYEKLPQEFHFSDFRTNQVQEPMSRKSAIRVGTLIRGKRDQCSDPNPKRGHKKAPKAIRVAALIPTGAKSDQGSEPNPKRAEKRSG